MKEHEVQMFAPTMSALGQKRTFCSALAMSALPPEADIHRRLPNVR